MPHRKIRVYIAGPYTTGDPVVNTHAAMKAWHTLWKAGFIPVCPHWTMFQHLLTPLPYEEWLEYDQHILDTCDVLVRLPGKSAGADNEINHAISSGIEIFEGVEAFLNGVKA